MNRIFILIFLLVDLTHASAQNQFYKIGDSTGVFNLVSSVKQNMEGEFVFFCNYPDTDTYLRSAFIKLNQSGDTIMTKLYKSTNSFLPNSFEQTSDSGYILSCNHTTGGTTSFGIVLIRISKDGNLIWSKGFGDTLSIRIGAVKCKPVFGNGFIVSTTALDNSTQALSAVLIRLDNNGDTIWTKTYLNTGEEFDLQITPDSGFALIGNSFLLKTDSTGNLLWGRKYPNLFALFLNIVCTNDGGYAFSYSDGSKICIAKVDSIGDFEWGKIYGVVGNTEYAYSMKQSMNGGFVLAGFARDNINSLQKIILIRADSIGDTLWVKSYGANNNQTAFNVIQTSDGGFLIGGSAQDLQGFDSRSLIIKTDSMGLTSCSNYNYPLDVNSFTLLDTTLSVIDTSGFSIRLENVTVESGMTFSSPCSGVSVPELEVNNFSVYPNPSSGRISINSNDQNVTFDLSIYNSLGSLVRIEKNLSGNCILNLEEFRSGLYLFNFRIGQKNYYEKIVIE